MNNYTEDMFQAISIIAQQAVKKANYDKTIQATIMSCVDPTIGKYKVSYQDGTWYAFSNNTNTKYIAGTSVYILIPGGDMNNTKTIIGTTKQLGINYINTVEETDKYTTNGNNILTDASEHALCSYVPKTIVLYDSTKSASQNSIKIDTGAAATYIKSSSNFIVSASVRTALPLQQRYGGNYGITFYLDFIDNAQKNTITRIYTFDVDSMQGNPYILTNTIRQKKVFEIDGSNFVKISKIEIFVKDFPNTATSGKINDIFISNISFTGATELTEEELNGVSLQLIAKKGYIFTSSSATDDTRTIEAQVRVLGKAIDNNSQKLSFYWFVQDIGVTSKSVYYHKYGGQGWKCLNKSKVISTNPAIVEYNPGSYSFSVKKSDILIKQQKYKCVVVYDGSIFSKEFTVLNNAATYTINITSDKGTEFVKDVGYPTLTCTVTSNSSTPSELQYVWSEINSSGVFTSLADQTGNYNKYQNILTEYNRLKTGFKNGSILKNSYYSDTTKNITEYNNLETELKTLNKTQFITKNKIIHLNIKKIVNFSTFKCSVYTSNNNLIGTASITIVNKLTSNGGYTVVINDGTQTFNYDENGVSPCNSSKENPYNIPALSFTVYDMKGNELQTDIISKSDVQWIVPITNTMIINSSNGTSNADQTEKTVTNTYTLAYSINNKYYANKTNNDIKLKINYNGYTITAKTNLSFVKEGQNGTNGTDFVVKIVPVDSSGKYINDYPYAITTTGNTYNFNFNHLRAQLWHNGELIFNDRQTGTSEESKSVTVVWSILKNKYSSTVSDNTSFNINAINGKLSDNNSVNLKTLYTELNKESSARVASTIYNNSPANIIKLALTYDSITYYATLPIITVYTTNSDLKVTLTPNTGFRYVIYSEDGRRPQYDNHEPFTFKVTQKINNSTEDISISTIEGYNPTYTAYRLGTIYQNGNRISKYNLESSINNIYPTWIAEKTYAIKDRVIRGTSIYECKVANSDKNWDGKHWTWIISIKNQKVFKPTDTYDGLCVTNAIACIVKVGNNSLFIHVPIHFMLNRYGHSAINAWDGNSVSIDADGNNTILAPQVGAGIKNNNDNSFTGIVMGAVKNTNSSTPQTGLFGYSSGVRTIFLDASNGKSHFGKPGAGQIIINPAKNEAKITSGNYNTSSGTGMQINLSTPSIRYGSGNFVVNANGHLTAKGGGSLAGWNFDDDSLWKPENSTASSAKTSDTNIRLSSVNFPRNINGTTGITTLRLALGTKFGVTNTGSLYAGDATLGTGSNKIILGKSAGTSEHSAIYTGSKNKFDANSAGFYIGTDGIALGNYANNRSNFQVTSSGELTAKSGYIGNGSSGFTIKSNAIYNGKDGRDAAKAGVYVGTDGISLGYNSTVKKAPFSVTSGGSLTAFLGNIAGFTINNTSIYNGKESLTSTKNGVYIGTNGIALGYNTGTKKTPFSVKEDGTLTASMGKIAGFTINDTSIYNNKTSLANAKNGVYIGTDGISLGYNTETKKTPFSVDSKGALTASLGKIAGFTINDTSIYNGKNDLTSTSAGVFIGTKGIALGSYNAQTKKAMFSVNSSGYLTANSGQIATWIIGEKSLRTSNSKNKFDKTDVNGVYLGTDGIRLGGNFNVDPSGVLTAKSGNIAGFTIAIKNTPTYRGVIYSGKTSLGGTSNGVYIGTDGISLGYNSATKKTPFWVDSNGALTASKGTIANWTIGDSYLATGTNSYTDTNGMYFGSGGLRLGSNFHVSSGGTLSANEGNIGPWHLTASGIYNDPVPNNATVSLTPGQFKLGNFTVTSAGALSGGSGNNKWSIEDGGDATFGNLTVSNITVTGGKWQNGTISGGSRTGGSITGGSISPGGVSMPLRTGGNGTMTDWCAGEIDYLAVSRIKVTQADIADLKATKIDAATITGSWIAGKLSSSNLTTSGIIKTHTLTVEGTLNAKSSQTHGLDGNVGGLSFTLGICTGIPNGLNADTLDSHDSNYFAKSDHTHSLSTTTKRVVTGINYSSDGKITSVSTDDITVLTKSSTN